MRIHEPSTIQFARDAVFGAYRDNLPELVQYLPNIGKIEVVKKEETADGILKLENHWYAEANIPKVAQRFIKPEMLKWVDYATWNAAEKTCDWRIETMFMKEAITCQGHNIFSEKGDDAMELCIDGELVVNSIPGVPKLLAGSIKPQLEKFIVSLITPNFNTINQSIASFLRARGV